MSKAVIKNQKIVSQQKMVSNYPICFGYLKKINYRLKKIPLRNVAQLIILLAFLLLRLFQTVSAQTMQPQFSTQFQQNNNNYLRNSTAFRQEIARFEFTVHREGKQPLSLSQVPRVQQGDVIKVKLLNEAVNGVKLDQSLYNWTMLVAFINPNRKFVDGKQSAVSSQQLAVRNKNGLNNSFTSSSDSNSNSSDNNSKNPIKPDKESSVSAEIVFRKTGWYKEYSFTVPYDSQPMFFLYPRPGYRGKLLNLINKNYKEIRQLGEKTIEIAGAYGQISLFLNELQGVISGNSNYANGYGSSYGSSYGSTPYYGGTTGGYSSYNPYNPYQTNYPGYNQQFNFNLFIAQAVERMARGFNISLPNNCWQGSQAFANSTSFNSYNPYGGSYGSTNGLSQVFQPSINPELVTRLQCVAKNIRLEDFDLSVSKLLQQGGMLLALQLQKQYPQLSYWINVAALAIDLIVKITKKSPLRIVPAVSSSSDNPNSGSYGGYGNTGGGAYGNQGGYGNQSPYNPNAPNPNQPMPKISLFAESQPDDNQFVTAYPIILHKWQPEADTEVISLRPPILAEPCLHAGVNILKSTDLSDEQLQDAFTKDYKLTMSSTNGFRKEFPLRKNLGLNGWELNITPQELQEFPKIQMTLESVIKGTRGFNEISTPPFYLPISLGGSWQITPESQQNFVVGGRRRITIKNTLGNCQCLQAVIYKPSFGGQFVFEAGSGGSGNSSGSGSNSSNNNQNQLQYSPDGKEAYFEVDATNFQAGAGELELRTFGGEATKIPLKLYPAPPNITDFKIRRGDKEILLTGDRLEQIQSISINGRRAINPYQTAQSSGGSSGYGNQPNYQQPSYNQPNQPSQPGNGNQPNTINSVNSPNSANSQNSMTYPKNTLQSNQKVFILQDSNALIEGNQISLELVLEDNRSFTFPQRLTTLPARPTIVANEMNELIGTFLRDGSRDEVNKVKSQESGVKSQKSRTANQSALHSPLSTLHSLPKDTVSIDSNELTITVQNKLTDYNFMTENLQIETGVENSTINQGELPQVKFEVLDTNNLRINLTIPEATKKYLGGRRIRFRIKDRERGDSDWYLIKQTFVRFPKIEAIKCDSQSLPSLQSSPSLASSNPTPNSPNSVNPPNYGNSVNSPNSVNSLNCLMSGVGLDYISQVSVDGGLSWYPGSTGSLQAQLLSDGTSTAMIPLLQNKKSLMIKLRDYPKAEGIFIENFSYLNSIKGLKKPVAGKGATNQGQVLNQPNGQINNQRLPNNQGQTISPIMQNQPKSEKTPVSKQPKKKKN